MVTVSADDDREYRTPQASDQGIRSARERATHFGRPHDIHMPHTGLFLALRFVLEACEQAHICNPQRMKHIPSLAGIHAANKCLANQDIISQRCSSAQSTTEKLCIVVEHRGLQ